MAEMKMTGSSLQSLAAASGLDIRAEDLERAISRRNPGAPRERIELVVDLLGRLAEMSALLTRKMSAIEVRPAATVRQPDPDEGAGPPPAFDLGTGLGERIDPGEGARRLEAFASHLALEDWAGPVAGPAEIAARFGVPRSTLDDWRRSGAAVGLLRGARKHVFPLAQFVDGRPIPGLAKLTAIIGDPRAAWLWLVEPRRRGEPWLERLRRGEVERVMAAAREDFG